MVLAAATLYLISLSSMHSNGLADPGGQGSLSDTHQSADFRRSTELQVGSTMLGSN